ncbi:MAG TPA: hypothetical protein VIF09_05280 [Polyangiaceae bacterium]|jgi:hypothetical protein
MNRTAGASSPRLCAGLLFLALLFAVSPARAAAVLTVASAGEVTVAPEGCRVEVQVRDDQGAPSKPAPVHAALGDASFGTLVAQDVTTTNGVAVFFLQPAPTAVRGTLAFTGPDGTTANVGLHVVSAGAVDWAHIFGALASFLLLMLLLSIGAEKATDLVKLALWRKPSSKPEPRVQSYLLDNQRLVGLDEPTLRSLHALVCRENRAQPGEEREKVMLAIEAEDRKRAMVEQRYARRMRLIALVAGMVIAWAFKIDVIAVLSPILDRGSAEFLREHTWVGTLLSGFGASAGAPFWQDLFDQMTAAKKSAEALGGAGK